MAKGLTDKKTQKLKALKRLYEILGKYKTIIVVSLINVGSGQVQQVRKQLAEKNGLLVIGKNTIVKKAVSWRATELPQGPQFDEFRRLGGPIPELKEFIPQIHDKVGFIFTDQPIYEVKAVVEANKVSAPARAGTLAPDDVIIPPGPTGMDPSQISFFHALSISTKIVKNQIEIVKDYHVCKKDQKIGKSEVTLLQKMGIKPFFYNMNVLYAYDNGAILNKEICALDPQDIIKKFQNGVKNLASLSLELGDVNEISAPIFLTNAFKNLAAIGLEVNYKFKQIENAGQQQVAVQAPVQGKKEPEKPVVVEKEKSESFDGGLDSMFD